MPLCTYPGILYHRDSFVTQLKMELSYRVMSLSILKCLLSFLAPSDKPFCLLLTCSAVSSAERREIGQEMQEEKETSVFIEEVGNSSGNLVRKGRQIMICPDGFLLTIQPKWDITYVLVRFIDSKLTIFYLR